MYSLMQKMLFQLDAEQAHHMALKSLKTAHCLGLNALALPRAPQGRACSLMGLNLPNPVGLAAGLDKNGEYIDALFALGFGFVEIGTVTPKPQSGNPKPRLFRLPEHHAIINRMGFNNHGIDAMIEQIKKAKNKGILGINIGKNATTPIENAADDYLICLEKAYPYADYIVVNISSPNTQNLRSLQEENELSALLGCLKDKQKQLSEQYQKYIPLAVKIAPDLDNTQIHSIAQVILACDMDGVIATNTTIDKSILGTHPLAQEAGGLSGAPVREKANQVLKQLAQELDGKIPIIGVGGISQGTHAQEKIQLGAQAVQLYSGMIYQGPALIHECIKATSHNP